MNIDKKIDKLEKKRLPRAVVGAFIFDADGKLFLMKSPAWQNQYACPGGKVEYGEETLAALKREVKEETNLDITAPEFLSYSEAPSLGDKYKQGDKHLIFLNFKAQVSGLDHIKLNHEGSGYKWLKPSEWLKKANVNQYTLAVIEKHLQEQAIESCESRYLRALADYQNLLKQSAKEKQEFVKYANERMLFEMLPVYDNLKISLAHIDEAASQNGWAEGIKYVVKQFKDVLEGVGVEEIQTEGKKFDHHTMEAVEGQGEKVKKEIKPGYKLHGKLIIPAKVVLE